MVEASPAALANRYRPDIDGLRAIAVLPVALFHLGFMGFGGGFLGVDVFFVISGYLITGHIAADIEKRQFSIARFYERRIRRIFPALFLVVAATTAAAAMFYFPRDLILYANSLVATSLFGSNIEFWREAGYFDAAAQSKPLLHTWSLGVEEQYYLLFPLLLMATARLTRSRLLVVLAGVLLLSLLFCLWTASRSPAAGFYLFPSRLWELVVGALLAIAAPRPGHALARAAASAVGLVILAVCVTLVSPETPMPQAAIGPCLGAALIILGGASDGSPVNALLSWRPLVFLGKISYSLYLWHWPIIVLATYKLDRALTPAEAVAVLVASILLAVFSWRFIEQPFRRQGARQRPALVLRRAALVSATTVALGLTLLAFQGIPERFDPAVQQTLAAASDTWPERGKCLAGSGEINADSFCRLGATEKSRLDFLLWGDSHAAALAPALADVARRSNQSGVLAAHAACAPLMGVERYEAGQTRDCAAFNDRVMQYAIVHRVRMVFLAARWALWAEGSYMESGSDHVTVKERASDAATSNNEAVFARALARTIGRLRQAGISVVVVGPIPENDRKVPEGLAHRDMEGRAVDFAPTLESFGKRQHFVLSTIAALQARYDVETIYPHLWLCKRATCDIRRNGKPLYIDDHHLSLTGARDIETMFAASFEGGGSRNSPAASHPPSNR